ncbi:MAG TPA: hypothetical protein VN324_07400, partial [Quisquiliibacterium sp.]|nr:hypothetical protein [Quisquiliibacterium sp.]
DTRRREAASSGDRKTAANRDGATANGDGDGDGRGRRLLEVLASLDLDDLPADLRERAEAAEQALEALRRGDWLRLGGDGEAPVHAKVAWINARRTVVLMVRRPDRRAVSMRSVELLERFRQGRAARIG